MKHDPCPPPFVLAELSLLEEGDARRAHLARCAECASLVRLSVLARALPAPLPSAERRESVRTALLLQAQKAAPVSARRWPLSLAAGIGLLLGAGLWWRLLSPGGAPTPPAAPNPPEVAASAPAWFAGRGEVLAQEGASLERQAGPDGGEVLSLRSGRISLRVAPPREQERFLVRVGGAEVEIVSAEVTISAYEGELASLSVTRGTVLLRLAGGEARRLGAGETWPPEPSTLSATVPSEFPAPIVEAPAERPAPPALPEGAPASLPLVPREEPASPGEEALESGAAALRAGEYEKAAAYYEEAVNALRDPTLVEDARFFRGSALARAGRTGEAIAALRTFVEKHPKSSRAGQARVALATLLAREGQLKEAEALFQEASTDPSSSVRERAADGLRALSPAP